MDTAGYVHAGACIWRLLHCSWRKPDGKMFADRTLVAMLDEMCDGNAKMKIVVQEEWGRARPGEHQQTWR